jgi:hypothetical protein
LHLGQVDAGGFGGAVCGGELEFVRYVCGVCECNAMKHCCNSSSITSP